MKHKPRFKVGDELIFSPLSNTKFNRPVWIVSSVDEDCQIYYLKREKDGKKYRRTLFFDDQRKWRIYGVPFEEQPPKYL